MDIKLKHFQDTYHEYLHLTTYQQNELKIIEYFPNTLPDASSATKHFTIAEITREIKLLNNKKTQAMI